MTIMCHPDLPKRLSDKLVVDEFGCWVPQSAWTSRNGYKRVWWKGKGRPFHQVVWEVLRGALPKKHPFLHHKCHNRACCNPLHVEPVDAWGNTLEAENTCANMIGEYGDALEPVQASWFPPAPVVPFFDDAPPLAA